MLDVLEEGKWDLRRRNYVRVPSRYKLMWWLRYIGVLLRAQPYLFRSYSRSLRVRVQVHVHVPVYRQ
jgi:hypothetical protein